MQKWKWFEKDRCDLVGYFSTCFCTLCICNCFAPQSVGMKFISNQSIPHIHSSYLHLLRLIDLTTFSCSHQGTFADSLWEGLQLQHCFSHSEVCISHHIFKRCKTRSACLSLGWYKWTQISKSELPPSGGLVCIMGNSLLSPLYLYCIFVNWFGAMLWTFISGVANLFEPAGSFGQ